MGVGWGCDAGGRPCRKLQPAAASFSCCPELWSTPRHLIADPNPPSGAAAGGAAADGAAASGAAAGGSAAAAAAHVEGVGKEGEGEEDAPQACPLVHLREDGLHGGVPALVVLNVAVLQAGGVERLHGAGNSTPALARSALSVSCPATDSCAACLPSPLQASSAPAPLAGWLAGWLPVAWLTLAWWVRWEMRQPW